MVELAPEMGLLEIPAEDYLTSDSDNGARQRHSSNHCSSHSDCGTRNDSRLRAPALKNPVLTIKRTLTDEQIRDALSQLASGRQLDPPRETVAAWAKEGNHQALIQSHHWLLVAKAGQSLIGDFGQPALNDDLRRLVTAGYQGLVHSARVFDPDRGYKFGTWATWCIADAIAKEKLAGADQ